MRPLPHILVGAVIGRLAPNPAVAFIGGLISHAVLDAIPHTDGDTFQPYSNTGVIIDLGTAAMEGVVGLSYVAWMARGCGPSPMIVLAAGVLGGLLPDMVDFPLERLSGRMVLHVPGWHIAVKRDRVVFGVLTQLAVTAIAGLLVRRLSC